MASPHPYTAQILDRMIRALDLTEPLPDIALALKEYGLGAPQAAPRDLDLCYGLAVIEPSNSSNAFAPIVLGKGLERSGANDPAVVNSAGELVLDPFAELSSVVLQNAYLFGSIHLLSWESSGTHSNDVGISLYKGGVNNTGSPLILCKDVGLSVAQGWLRNGTIGAAAPIPPEWAPIVNGSPVYASLEIYRFLIDITYYDSDNEVDNRYTIYLEDLRRTRGVFGFAEEVLAATLVPFLSRYEGSIVLDRTTLNAAIREIVRQWVLLPSWQPNFAGYWQASPVPMPARLQEYLLEELQYVV